MSTLTEKQALNRSRATCLGNVKNLNCWGSDLNDISLVREMINLEVLNLSVNNVTTLKDLSFCPRLKELYLRKNQIIQLDEIKYLKNLTCLKVLWLTDNPCANSSNYRETILRNLPTLTKLDSTEVSGNEVERARESGDSFEDDTSLPNYVGLDLNHTLTLDAVLKYTSQPKENINDEKPNKVHPEEKIIPNVTKSVDIDLANKRRAELGLKELDVSCSVNYTDSSNLNGFDKTESATTTDLCSKQQLVDKKTNLSGNSNILNAVLFLLNDLNTDELQEVVDKANAILDDNNNMVEIQKTNTQNVLTD